MRGSSYYNKRYINNSISLQNRILCSIFYPFPIMGIAAFIYFIVSFIKGKSYNPFVRFHAIQSLLLLFLIYTLNLAINIIFNIFGMLPIIGPQIVGLQYFLMANPSIFGMSPFYFIIFVFSLYLAISAFMGKYGEVPRISDAVRRI